MRYGAVLRYQAKIDESAKALEEATEILARLKQQGDSSEATVIGLAMGRSAQARVATSRSDFAEAARLAAIAAEVITPLASATSPSVRVRRAYAGVMVQLGFVQQRRNQEEDAVKSLQAARAAARSIDDLALGDLAAAADYTEAASWEVDALRQLGRHDEARRVGADGLAVAERILDMRPGHMPALRAHALLASGLSNTEDDSLNLARALEYSVVSENDWKTYRQIDPTNAIAWNNQLATGGQTWGLYWRMGRVADALQKGRAMTQPYLKGELPSMIAGNLAFTLMFQGILEADAGNRREAEAAFADARRLAAAGLRDLPVGSLQRTAIRANLESVSVARLLLDLDHQAQRVAADALAKELEATKPPDASQERFRNTVLRSVRRQLAVSSYRLGDYARAEEESRRVMALLKKDPPATLNDRRDASDDGVLLALTLARLNRAAEAREVIAPELAFQRELAARRDNDDMTQRLQLAGALYASAVAGDAKRAAQLKEAAALLDALPAQMKALRSTATLRGWIADEQKRG